MVAPVLEAIAAGMFVGFVNRLLARLALEQNCQTEAQETHDDDSDVSTASSGTVEVLHMT